MAAKPISQNVTISGEDGRYQAEVTSDGAIKVTGSASGLPFAIGGATAPLSVTAASSNVSLAAIGAHLQVMVTAPASNAATAFIKFGTDNTVAAAVTDTPILAGTVQVFTIESGVDYAAGITASSTATLYFTPGDGQ